MNKSAIVLGLLFLCGASDLPAVSRPVRASAGVGVCIALAGLGEYFRHEQAKAQEELDAVKTELEVSSEEVEENEFNFRGIPGLLQEEEKSLEGQVHKLCWKKRFMYTLALISMVYSGVQIMEDE